MLSVIWFKKITNDISLFLSRSGGSEFESESDSATAPYVSPYVSVIRLM